MPKCVCECVEDVEWSGSIVCVMAATIESTITRDVAACVLASCVCCACIVCVLRVHVT